MQLRAHILDDLNLTTQDFPRQAIVGDTHRRHTAGLAQRLEYLGAVPLVQQVIGRRDARRPRTDNRHARRVIRQIDRVIQPFHGRVHLDVRHETLQVLDVDRIVQLAATTGEFAKPHADPPADRSQRILFLDDRQRVRIAPRLDRLDIAGNIQPLGTGLDARRRHFGMIVAAHAAPPFPNRPFKVIAVMIQQRQDSVHRGVSQLTHRAGLYQLAHLTQRRQIALASVAIGDARQYLGGHARAHAAGNALAT